MFCPPRIIVFAACTLLALVSRAAEEPLRNVRDIRALTPEQAARRLPVELSGVITYSEPTWFLTFFSDATGGIYLGTTRTGGIPPGTRVRITGVTERGKSVPIVVGKERTRPDVEILEGPDPSRPIEIDPALLMGGTYDAQWIRVNGTVRTVTREHDRAVIDLDLGGRQFKALLPGYGENRNLPDYLIGLPVSADGVHGTFLWDSGRVSDVALYVPSTLAIQIDPEFLKTEFNRPARYYTDLFKVPEAGDAARIRVTGKIGFVKPEHGFFLQVWEGNVASADIWVETSQLGSFKAGQMVSVTGRVEVENRKPQLRRALVQVIGQGPKILPEKQDPDQIAGGDHHGNLVLIEGTVLEQHSGLAEDSLILAAGRSAVCAIHTPLPGAARLPKFGKGSRVRLAGTCVLPAVNSASAAPFSFQLLLEDASDVEIVQQPPWWTVEKALWTLGATAFVAAGAFAWVTALRRRVRKQMETIRGHLERQTLHEERTRISREFHDTFEQHLVGIGLALQAAEVEASNPPRLRELLQEANNMARHTRVEARHAIWELRREAPLCDFASTVTADLASSAEAAKVALQVTVTGRERPLSGIVQNHLVRIAQESFTNAIKHGQPKRISIHLAFSESSACLTVTDDGNGFHPDRVLDSESGAFGLAGMRERAGRLKGALLLDSAPGRGTKVIATIPLDSKYR